MIEFRVKRQFLKDFKKISKKDQKNIIDLINAISESDNPIVEYKAAKIVGYESYYRYRYREYRIGIFFDGEVFEFSRILHRKEIYKKFP